MLLLRSRIAALRLISVLWRRWLAIGEGAQASARPRRALLPLTVYLLVAALVLQGCQEPPQPDRVLPPEPAAVAPFDVWHQTGLERWVYGDLVGAHEAFQHAERNRARAGKPEWFVPFYLDWMELSLALGRGAEIPARVPPLREALRLAMRQGNLGASDRDVVERLVATFEAAALRDSASPADAAAALEALGPSPWSGDHWFFLGQVYERMNQPRQAAAAYRAYLDAAPRLSHLRRAARAQAEATTYLAQHPTAS